MERPCSVYHITIQPKKMRFVIDWSINISVEWNNRLLSRHWTRLKHLSWNILSFMQNDIKKLFSWVLKHPVEETGGNLFGSWEEARFILMIIMAWSMLNLYVLWLSHRNALNPWINRVTEDEKMVWKTIPSRVLMIANITDRKVARVSFCGLCVLDWGEMRFSSGNFGSCSWSKTRQIVTIYKELS